MHHRRTVITGLILVVLASLALAACGSSSDSSESPGTLLNQTFTGTHKVTSGVLNLTLTIDPSGSSTLGGPITLRFGGPFQTRGAGKLPESNFTVSASALGRSLALGILSTGTSGYVTLQGTSYQMPQATFQKLESSFAQLATTGSASQGSGTLGKLGIHPLKWLTHPTNVGTETVGGRADHPHPRRDQRSRPAERSEHVHREGLLGQRRLGRLQAQVRPIGEHPPEDRRRDPATRAVDVWTGTSDKTVRRLTISLTVPVTGQTSRLSSAA